MSITPEMLAAYADGELKLEERAEVDAAIAADPLLARQVAAHRTLREALSARFDPILEMPVPDRLSALLTPTAQEPANVVDIAAGRAAKRQREYARVTLPRWAAGGAIAASLAIGLVIGGKLPSGGSIRNVDGQLVASGGLETALSTQLASAQSDGKPVRILLSFKSDKGHYCRGFGAGATLGIACREDGNWRLVRIQSDSPATGGEYRQAGSADADIMAAAQNMASGAALDPDAERGARDAGWHN